MVFTDKPVILGIAGFKLTRYPNQYAKASFRDKVTNVTQIQ